MPDDIREDDDAIRAVYRVFDALPAYARLQMNDALASEIVSAVKAASTPPQDSERG